jgi:hypothetical protein
MLKNCNAKQKVQVLDKIRDMYSGNIAEYVIKEDYRFEKMMEMLHRCNIVAKANSNLIEQ